MMIYRYIIICIILELSFQSRLITFIFTWLSMHSFVNISGFKTGKWVRILMHINSIVIFFYILWVLRLINLISVVLEGNH